MLNAVPMQACLLLLLSHAFAAKDQPSFLFMLGDDIGWADFRYNNGTAASPRISEWTQSAGSIIMQDFHSGSS